MANFRKGGAVAEEAAAKANTRFSKVEYLSLEKDETVILRFMTDHTDWITVNNHAMIGTKSKPADFEGNWPDTMGAVCRHDQAFEYPECYICDFGLEKKDKKGKPKKPQPRTWALACIREEVIENGQVVGIKDRLREVQRKKEGSEETEKVIEKDIVVVKFAWSNFWHNIQAAAGHYGTVLDRDFLIKRKGEGLDTEYNCLPLDPINVSVDANGDIIRDPAVQGTDVRFDLRNEKFMALYPHNLDLEDIITRQSNEEWYARWFDPRFSIDKEGNVVKTGEAPEPKPDNDVAAADRLAALSERVKSYGNGAPATEPAAAPSTGMRNYT
jgi:hypothetical protein